MHKHIKTARTITYWLEGKYKIGYFKFGFDALLGIIPGIGDVVPALLSGYLIWIAYRIKLPQEKVSKMIANIILDFIIGSIPLVGDLTDFMFKSNIKNLAILEEHIGLSDGTEIIEGEIIEERIPTKKRK